MEMILLDGVKFSLFLFVCLQQTEARLASLLSAAHQLLHHVLVFHHSHMILHFLISESGMFLFVFLFFLFQSKELRYSYS